MKIYLSPFKRSRGSAMVFAVLILGLVSGLIAVYMTLVTNQNRATMRSQAWNATVPIIEAGIEEALTHLTVNGVDNLGADGWTLQGGQYIKQRPLGDGFYIVAISNGPSVVITSQGYIRLPGVSAEDAGTVIGTATAPATALLESSYMGRGVRIITAAGSLYAKGLVAKGQINLNGNNIETDSFDSSDPNYSTGGSYDPAKAKDRGDVATNSGLVNSVSVGNATIKGKVSTGPGGSVAIGPNGAVGDASWHEDGHKGIQPGYATDDMNVTFPDVEPPFTGGGFEPGPGSYGGQNWDYVLGTGNFELGGLSLSGEGDVVVTGHAVLYVTGDVSMSGNAFIRIEPGASLKLYGGGFSTQLGGGGVINQGGNATNFYYYGLPGNKSLSISGNGELVGIIYAPQAHMALNGGGNSENDVIGASITKSVTMNGHFKFHYDEALAAAGGNKSLVVKSWTEMEPSEMALLAARVRFLPVWY